MSLSPLTQVVEGGYCIGCGACSAASANRVSIRLNDYGMYQAVPVTLPPEIEAKTNYSCPFTDDGPNEDTIGSRLFGAKAHHDPRIGYYLDTFVGHVCDPGLRSRATSGGIITWLLAKLLELNLVDVVCHVTSVGDETEPVLFRYGISKTAEEVMQGAKSRYYPIELSGVLQHIKNNPGRYAVTGLPCFIKAIRRLTDQDEQLRERIVFCVGLVCGHLKSKAYAEYFAWQQGVKPGDLAQIDFRVKLPGRKASDYGVKVTGSGKVSTVPASRLDGANWGLNYFRYPACDCCDDVFAETADIAVGDAWLSEYEADASGNSIIVVRDVSLLAIIEQARDAGILELSREHPNRIAQSQAGGLRDRREGLSYRLHLKSCTGEWYPQKRVFPNASHLSSRRRRVYRARRDLGIASHRFWYVAKNSADLSLFSEFMKPYVRRYWLANTTWRVWIWRLCSWPFRAALRAKARYARR